MKRTRRVAVGERGSVLLVSLMILLMLTILGLAAVQTTTLEERMAGNSSEQSRAFQAAEAALRDAEAEIDAGTRMTSRYGAAVPENVRRAIGAAGFSADATNGLCTPMIVDNDARYPTLTSMAARTALLGGNDPTKYTVYSAQTAAVALTGVAAPPRYLIEFSCEQVPGSSNCEYSYRLTAMGFGPRFSSRTVLEAVYRAR